MMGAMGNETFKVLTVVSSDEGVLQVEDNEVLDHSFKVVPQLFSGEEETGWCHSKLNDGWSENPHWFH
jgi:hypothetical protein